MGNCVTFVLGDPALDSGGFCRTFTENNFAIDVINLIFITFSYFFKFILTKISKPGLVI